MKFRQNSFLCLNGEHKKKLSYFSLCFVCTGLDVAVWYQPFKSVDENIVMRHLLKFKQHSPVN